jgi:hypothetical protein
MSKRIAPEKAENANGSSELPEQYIGSGADHKKTFDAKTVVNIGVADITLQDASSRSRNGTLSQGFACCPSHQFVYAAFSLSSISATQLVGSGSGCGPCL